MAETPTRRGRLVPPALVAAALAGWALPARASPALDLYLGPHDTTAFTAKGLRVLLDGAPLPVALPAAGVDPAQAVYSGPVAPGAHRLELELVVAGATPFFTYTHDYLFTLRGQLDLPVRAGEVVAVQARVTTDGGVTVPWVDRNRLALRATHYRSRRAEAPDEEAGAGRAAPPAAPVAATPAVAPAPATACALETIHFAFDKATLDARALAAIDGFARCLAGSGATVRLQGHADPQGPAAYNQRLSERRARAVAAALAERGVARERIRVEAFGESRLLCAEPNPACNARNRRVEAVVERGP